MARNEPTNSDDILDSRDIIARIDELESDRETLTDTIEELKEMPVEDREEDYDETLAAAHLDLTEWDDDNGDELKALKALADEGENCADDWMHGATLIREDYFVDYCRDLVSDIGDMPRNIPSYIVIDWDATADNLRADYSEVDFDGETYLIR